jgi:predicted nucleotidyltransferase
MVSLETITSVSDQIAQAYHPEQIILFGSYAYGTPRPDSDVDLLVVMPIEGQAVYKAVEILEHVRPPFAVDLLVRTPQELARRLSLNDFFLRDIVTKGRVLYASTHDRMG